MLPEHRGSLQQQAAQSRRNQEHHRPVLDEQEQEQLQQVLDQALLRKQAIRVTVLDDSGRYTYTGIPLRSDPATGKILLSAAPGKTLAIKVADVVHLEQADHR